MSEIYLKLIPKSLKINCSLSSNGWIHPDLGMLELRISKKLFNVTKLRNQINISQKNPSRIISGSSKPPSIPQKIGKKNSISMNSTYPCSMIESNHPAIDFFPLIQSSHISPTMNPVSQEILLKPWKNCYRKNISPFKLLLTPLNPQG